MASSTSHGRFVAASTITRACSFVWNPSHMVMNSVFIDVFASCSLFFRAPRNESTSSMKMMLGCSFHASENTAATSLLASPNHLLCSVDVRTLMKHARHSLASALARSVLPVPGGPYSMHPLTGRSRLPPAKSSGRSSGKMTISCSARLVSPSPPMESNVVLISIGFATSHAMMSSYWFVTMLGRPRRRAISFFFAAAASRAARLGSRSLYEKWSATAARLAAKVPARSSTRISWPPMRCPPPRGAMPLCWPMQSGRALKCKTGEEREVSSFAAPAALFGAVSECRDVLRI